MIVALRNPHRRVCRQAAFLAAVLWQATCTAPAGAQVTAHTRAVDLLANALIGGTIAGLRTLIVGGPAWRPVLGGVAGGVVHSVGAQVAGSSFSGAGLLGREISAAGISLARSAEIDSVVVLAPIGPATLEIRPRAPHSVHVRVSAVDVVAIAAAVADGHSTFDLGATLSAGAPVFLRPESHMPFGPNEGGVAVVGTIFLAEGIGGPYRRRVLLPHETVHVLQWDEYAQLVTLPTERALLQHVPGGASITRYVDVGAIAPASVYLASRHLAYCDQPWEREAYALTGEPFGCGRTTVVNDPGFGLAYALTGRR